MQMTFGARLSRIGQLITARKWQLLTLFIAVLLPLLLFGALADEVLEGDVFFFDEPILLFAHSLASPAWNMVTILFSRLGYRQGVVPLDFAIWCLLLARRRVRDSTVFGLSVGGAGVLNMVAKAFFGRVRPRLWESVAPETTLSFPSGHAMGSMALVAALVVLLWPTKWRYPMLGLGAVFVVMVGLSRIYLGVHYPSDVLAGWVASFAWVMGISMLIYRQVGRPAPMPAQSPPPMSAVQPERRL